MLEPSVGGVDKRPPSPSLDPNAKAEIADAPVAATGDWAAFWLDLSGRVARWGDRAVDLFALEADEAVGMPIADLFSPEARAAGIPARALQGAHQYGGWDSTCVLGVEGRRCRRCSVNVSYVTTPNGLAIGYMLVARVLEAKTERAGPDRRLLEAGRLAGDVAHEVGNLFAAIRGFAGVLEGVLPSTGTSHQVWHELVKACDRGKHLTRRLLDAGKDEPVDAIDLAREIRAFEAVLRQALPKRVQLIVRIGGGLPLVRGRSCEVESVLMNLVLNARDAIDGEGFVQISAAGRTDPNTNRRYVELVVQDSGRGMTPHVSARAFERFFTTKRASGGAGVGLSVVREAVSSMGGSIELERAHPAGTRARVRVPAALAAPAEDSRRPVDLLDRGVLVLSSDRVLRDCIEELLVRQGVHVTTTSGAIDEVALERTTLAIVAADSPEGGETTLGRIRALRPGIRVLMVSEEVSDAALRQGVIPLSPSFTPGELIEAVRALPPAAPRSRLAVN